jgi:hypothetical protein
MYVQFQALNLCVVKLFSSLYTVYLISWRKWRILSLSSVYSAACMKSILLECPVICILEHIFIFYFIYLCFKYIVGNMRVTSDFSWRWNSPLWTKRGKNVQPVCSVATRQSKILISFTHFKLPSYANVRCITYLIFHSVCFAGRD